MTTVPFAKWAVEVLMMLICPGCPAEQCETVCLTNPTATPLPLLSQDAKVTMDRKTKATKPNGLCDPRQLAQIFYLLLSMLDEVDHLE